MTLQGKNWVAGWKSHESRIGDGNCNISRF
jgi:hypothetical protein